MCFIFTVTASPTSAIGNLITLYIPLIQSKTGANVPHNFGTLTHSSKLEKLMENLLSSTMLITLQEDDNPVPQVSL
jgi:hypothetical protein